MEIDLERFKFERKITWEQRLKLIHQQFPEVEKPNWNLLLRQDPQIMGKILNDILKAEGQGSKPGKRPGLNPKEAESNLRKLQSEDYSELEFYDAFTVLTFGRSVRNIANKVDLDKSYISRLQLKTAQPTYSVMEKIAKGFNKKPSYFLEYRKAAVIIALDKFLTQSPETATHMYIRITEGK